MQQAGQRRRRRCRHGTANRQRLASRAAHLPALLLPLQTAMAALPQPGNEGLPAFDDANPQAFYLRESWEEMASLSDAVLVAAGVRLPVHSQVGGSQWAAHGSLPPCRLAALPACL